MQGPGVGVRGQCQAPGPPYQPVGVGGGLCGCQVIVRRLQRELLDLLLVLHVVEVHNLGRADGDGVMGAAATSLLPPGWEQPLPHGHHGETQIPPWLQARSRLPLDPEVLTPDRQESTGPLATVP